MPPHDQLFKELLHAFFREFMELFLPHAAQRIDFSEVTFLDREVFTDVPDGARREADVVAQTRTIDGEPELIRIHIEIQTDNPKDFGARMLEYYSLLRLRKKLPVFPVCSIYHLGSAELPTK